MAEFEAKVYRLTIEEHPNADALELARVGDYRAVVQKDLYKTGDLGVYIPEGAVLQDWMISALNLEGRLAGKQKNRVKAVKLRGVLSQGLIYPVIDDPLCYRRGKLREGMTPRKAIRRSIGGGKEVFGNRTRVHQRTHIEPPTVTIKIVEEGDIVTDWLQVTKYEPPIPVHMSGEVFNAHEYTLGYDIENIKKYPDVLVDGETVVITEKLHGTWCCMGWHPEVGTIVTSKGLSGQGLAFKFNEANAKNLYMRMLDATGNPNIVESIKRVYPDTSIYVLGEVYGKGVQDLHYGAEKPRFRIFDVYVGEPGKGQYLDYEELITLVEGTLLREFVPVLYKGPYSKEVVAQFTDGKTELAGEHIREGVVVTPVIERRDDMLGRVKLKSVSEKYLLRKGGTEYN